MIDTIFEVGDEVVISGEGELEWPNSTYNPHNTPGRVIQFNNYGTLSIRVQWSNGEGNSYKPSQLGLIL